MSEAIAARRWFADPIAVYWRDLEAAGSAPMTRAQETAEFARLAAGDESARERIITANLRFVVSVARSFEHRGLPLEDLVGYGNCGLLEAVGRFDPNRGTKFISYAVWWIRQAILQALSLQGVVRRPISATDVAHQAERIARRMSQRQGRSVTAHEAAVEMGWTPVECEAARVAAAPELSLDAPLVHDETRNVRSFHEVMSRQDDDLEAGNAREALLGVIVGFPARTRRILVERFGLDGEPARTLEQIGDGLGISRERVRQILDEALRRLRRSPVVAELA